MKIKITPEKTGKEVILTVKLLEASEVDQTESGITRIKLSDDTTLELLDQIGIKYILDIKRIGTVKV